MENVSVEGKHLFMRKQLKFPENIGMHVRIASLIAVEASRYTSSIKVCYKGSAYNAKSIIGLSSSVIEPGGTFELIVEGDDAEEAIKNIERIIQNGHL